MPKLVKDIQYTVLNSQNNGEEKNDTLPKTIIYKEMQKERQPLSQTFSINNLTLDPRGVQ